MNTKELLVINLGLFICLHPTVTHIHGLQFVAHRLLALGGCSASTSTTAFVMSFMPCCMCKTARCCPLRAAEIRERSGLWQCTFTDVKQKNQLCRACFTLRRIREGSKSACQCVAHGRASAQHQGMRELVDALDENLRDLTDGSIKAFLIYELPVRVPPPTDL